MLKLMIDDKTGKLRKTPLVVIVVLVICIFALAMSLHSKNTAELTEITESSIKSQLISISIAAAETLDVEAFYGYNSLADVAADQENYDRVLGELRALQMTVGAKYIYALKELDGVYYFVFDTDTVDDTIFIPYEIDDVQIEATKGNQAAGILNVQDEYGSYHTGAVPIYRQNELIGILCTDIADTVLLESKAAAQRNSLLLGVVMFCALTALMAFLVYLLRKVQNMQNKVWGMAHNDTITGLPNRLYLLEYLEDYVSRKDSLPFALVFIDLDNFKGVNDQAGHDAGDELLRKIARFLQQQTEQKLTFRPEAGYLNVSARVGGDEFIQVYPGAASMEDARKIAENLLNSFSPSISRYVEKYNVSLSIGIALYPYHSENYHALIKYADAAMYQAKRAGKNQFCIYTEGMEGEK